MTKMLAISYWIMHIDITDVIIFLVVLTTLLLFLTETKGNLPPGPRNLPIVGYLPFMIGRKTEDVFSDLKEKYGDIVYLRLGSLGTVILTSHNTIKDAMLANSEVAVTRPDDFSAINHLFDYQGHVVENGKIWVDQRRFLLRTLRDLGLGRQNLENEIQDEAFAVAEIFRKQNGEPIDASRIFFNSSANVVSALMFGYRYKYTDEEFQTLTDVFDALPNKVSPLKIVNSFPYMRYVLPTLLSGMAIVEEVKKLLHQFLDRKICEISKSDENSNNFTKFYLNQQRENQEKKSENTYTHERLRGNLLVLMAAGISTTASTLYWAMKMLIREPNIQTALQNEIDHVIGIERVPCYSSKLQMPYMDAFIMELHRVACVVPLGVPHATKFGTKLSGYDIPPNTTVITSIHLAHFDKNIWGDPQNFRPERFIGKDGKRIMTEYLVPFSTGKRSCPGENLASMEIFIILTSLLQSFIFRPASSKDTSIETGEIGFIRDLCPFKIIASPRSTTGLKTQ